MGTRHPRWSPTPTRCLSIAGVDIDLYFTGSALEEAIDQRTGAYQADRSTRGGYRLELHSCIPEGVRPGLLQNFDRISPSEYRLNRHKMLSGVVSVQERTGRFDIEPSRFAVDSLLRLLLNVELPRVGGALVHAAGVVWNGRGLMFPGVSGAGKSTLAANVGGEPVLTDEMVAVRQLDAVWHLFGTPFHGALEIPAQAGSHPLAAIVFPDRSLPSGVTQLRPSQALGRLLQTVVNYGDDPEMDRRMLAVAADLACDVPCYTLSYDKTAEIRPSLEASLDL